MPSTVCDEIIYPFPNFNGATGATVVLTNFIPHFIMNVVTYPYWDWRKALLVKWALGRDLQYGYSELIHKTPKKMICSLWRFVTVQYMLIHTYLLVLLLWYRGTHTIVAVPFSNPKAHSWTHHMSPLGTRNIKTTDNIVHHGLCTFHYTGVIMGAIASEITSLTIVYSTVYSDANQRKHQSSASLAFVWGIHRGPVNFPHKWPVTRKMFPFDDVIMFHLKLNKVTDNVKTSYICKENVHM